MYSEIRYLMCNFANKMQGVKQKATVWYSRGWVKRSEEHTSELQCVGEEAEGGDSDSRDCDYDFDCVVE